VHIVSIRYRRHDSSHEKLSSLLGFYVHEPFRAAVPLAFPNPAYQTEIFQISRLHRPVDSFGGSNDPA
jgi:hypothetical protein